MKKKMISVIGTCRVYEPHKLLFDKKLIDLNNKGVFGYTHTTKEALQLIKNINGDFVMDSDLITFVSKHGLESYVGKSFDSSDIIIIEVSSLRLIKIGDIYFRSNLILDFLSRKIKNITLWWKDLLYGRLTNKFDEKYKIDFSSLDEKSKSIITNIECIQQTFEDFTKDMKEIIALIGRDKRIIAISHFDMIMNEKATRVPERETIVSWLKDLSKSENFEFFNPRHELESFGIEKGIIDNAHYSKAFEEHISLKFYNIICKVYKEPLHTRLMRFCL